MRLHFNGSLLRPTLAAMLSANLLQNAFSVMLTFMAVMNG